MKTSKVAYRILFLLPIVYMMCGHAFAGQNINSEEKHATDDAAATFVSPIRLYQDHISRLDGNRCQMAPSCSQFCVNAIKKHGFFLGWIMCSDRLVRCGRDEGKMSSSIWINNEKRVYDPVSHNDFWWQHPK